MSAILSPYDVSRLSFGSGPLGNLWSRLDDDVARAAVARALELGITHFDTAPHYGRGLSERRVGDVLRERSGYTLSTKAGRLMRPDATMSAELAVDGFQSPMPFRPIYDYSGDGMLRSHEASLQRLGLAHVDLLLVHDIGRMNHGDAHPRYWQQLTSGGGLRALETLRDEQAVGGIGLGVNEVQICLDTMQEVRLDSILIAGRYTLLDQSALGELFDACLEAGTSVMVGAPFNSGILATGVNGPAVPFYDYAPAPPAIVDRVRRMEAVAARHGVPLPAAALQFPLAHPAVSHVVAGFRDAGQVEQGVAWIRHPIPDDFWADLRAEGLLRPDAPTSANQVNR